MTPYAERIREELKRLVEPLRDEERNLNARITELETELAELRTLRTELRRQVRALTGEPATSQDGKPHGNLGGKRKRKSGARPISEARLDRIMAWLEEHAWEYPEGFMASHLVRVPDFPVNSGSQSQASKAFQMLQERGLLVLDHMGAYHSKYYKLPKAPENE